jgi:hypothetical protein
MNGALQFRYEVVAVSARRWSPVRAATARPRTPAASTPPRTPRAAGHSHPYAIVTSGDK